MTPHQRRLIDNNTHDDSVPSYSVFGNLSSVQNSQNKEYCKKSVGIAIATSTAIFFDISLFLSFSYYAVIKNSFYLQHIPYVHLLFILTFLTAPIGAAVFGSIADRLGRKTSLMLSTSFLVCPPLITGAIPSYDKVGFSTILILLACRLIQSFSIGGLRSVIALFVIEHRKQEKACSSSAIVAFSIGLGSCFAYIISVIAFNSKWSDTIWRFAFYLSGTLIFFAINRMKEHTSETPQFNNIQKFPNKIASPSSVKTIFSRHKKSIALVAGSLCMANITFYALFITTSIFLGTKKCCVTKHSIYIISLIMNILLTPALGFLSDKIKSTFAMPVISSLVLMFLGNYLFYMITSTDNYIFSIGIISLSILNAMYTCNIFAIISNIFPTNLRCTGVSIGSAISSTLFGITTPFFLQFIAERHMPGSSTFFVFGSALSFICLYLLSKNKHEEIIRTF